MPKAGSDPDTTTPTGGRIHRNGWALSPFCPGAFRRSYWVLSAEICRLTGALREIGRIGRTPAALDWIGEPDLRRKKTEEIVKEECRKALVTVAILLWNIRYPGRALDHLLQAGGDFDGQSLRGLSPLGWEHIDLTGDCVLSFGCR